MYIRVMPIQHITDTTFSERGFFGGAYIWNGGKKTRLGMGRGKSTALTKRIKASASEKQTRLNGKKKTNN